VRFRRARAPCQSKVRRAGIPEPPLI